jgi:hypothetical protein
VCVEGGGGGVGGEPEGFAVVGVGAAGEMLFLALVDFGGSVVRLGVGGRERVTDWNAICEHAVGHDVFGELWIQSVSVSICLFLTYSDIARIICKARLVVIF